jgi:hypothetical protein
VQTRPAVNRVFSLPVSALGPITYEKSFVLSSGAIKNLYLTRDDGILWVEDVTNAPGVATQLYASAGATYASSVTASGAEYIALSDGVHGVDFPLQYDGTNLRRVTNDGPGLAPTVTSIALPSSTMATSGAITPGTIATIASSDPVAIYEGPYVGYVTYYTTITITLTAPTTAPIGTKVVVSGGTNPNLDVTSSILSISSTTTFKVNFYSQTLETGTGGTATFTSGITLQRQNNAVSCTTATAHGLRVGYQSQIQGAGTTVVGGTITSIVLNNEDTPGIATVTMTAVHGLLPGNFVNIAGVSGVTVGTAITNVAFNGNMVTITTSGAHGLSIGSQVNVAATTATWANGEWAVTSVPSTTTFTYAFYSTAAASTAADTGTVSYLWPLANVNPAQNYFTVQTAPTSTTFTITLSYTDGTWPAIRAQRHNDLGRDRYALWADQPRTAPVARLVPLRLGIHQRTQPSCDVRCQRWTISIRHEHFAGADNVCSWADSAANRVGRGVFLLHPRPCIGEWANGFDGHADQ